METTRVVLKNEIYTKQELENKTIIVLRLILKNKNLKQSGRKDELIERILDNQKSSNYFDILPKDILNIVSTYQIENNPNNLLVKEILNSENNRKYIFAVPSFDFKSFNLRLQETLLDIKMRKIGNLIEIIYGKLSIITDEQTKSFLLNLIKSGYDAAELNNELYHLNSNYRIIIYGTIRDSSYDYDVLSCQQ